MAEILRDGVRLVYHATGPGAAARSYLFVHGWCCDHSYFAPQAEFVSKAGARAVSLDLRGHGESDCPEGPYPIEQFADDTAALIEELGLEAPVVVGHSMGGITALALAARHPKRTRGIVMVDPSPFSWPATMKDGASKVIESLEAGDEAPLREFLETALFLPSDDPGQKAKIVREMLKTPRHVLIAAMRGALAFDGNAVAGRCAVPALLISADPPLNRQGEAAKALPGLIYAQTAGAGHFNQLLAPGQVNEMIDYFSNTYVAW